MLQREDAYVLTATNVTGSGKFKDDIAGQILDDKMVGEAQRLELGYFDDKSVWTLRPRAECRERTGKPPITVRWVIVNKGDDQAPNYRARLVARQTRHQGVESIFAPTPPLEAIRTVCSTAATQFPGESALCRDPSSEERIQISFIDIARAYFNAATDPNHPTYVELPPEHPQHGKCVGLLLKHMYGTLRAADGWQEEYSCTLVQELGFRQGLTSPCVFWHPERHLVCAVHGDDFTTRGSKRHLDWFETELRNKYELKTGERLGPGATDDKEATVLNRVVRWGENGLEYEADPRQDERLLYELNLSGAKAVSTPGLKPTATQRDEDGPLQPAQHTLFRGSAARGNYLSADRPDLLYSAKEICRSMATPTLTSLNALKRMCRFVVGKPRLVYRYAFQKVSEISVYTDTDWAGCPRTRRSTSGGAIMLGSHLIKSWSSTQPTVSLSSGEAEFYGLVKAAGMGLGYQALLGDIGRKLPVVLYTDSSAAIGIASRQGLGRLRRLDTRSLWIQQAARTGRITIRKVKGEFNPSDLFTKHLGTHDKVVQLVELFGCYYRDGRSAAAPELKTSRMTRDTLGTMVDRGAKPMEELDLILADDVGRAEFLGHLEAPDPEHDGLPHQLEASQMDKFYPKMRVLDEKPEDVLEDLAFPDPIELWGLAESQRIVRDTEMYGRRRRPACHDAG